MGEGAVTLGREGGSFSFLPVMWRGETTGFHFLSFFDKLLISSALKNKTNNSFPSLNLSLCGYSSFQCLVEGVPFSV